MANRGTNYGISTMLRTSCASGSQMKCIEYVRLDEVDPAGLATLLNRKKIREHLIDHRLFTVDTVKQWVRKKLEEGALPGCTVRAILADHQLAGWCGLQLAENKYEIAIVIDESHWGLGVRIFHDVMGWARDLGHEEVLIHLLHTRPEYRFLRKIAKNVYKSEILGNEFTTYELAVRKDA